jgi:hypothetical protein
MIQLPPPKWPLPPPVKGAKTTKPTETPIPVANLQGSRRIFAGLSWPVDGNPAFCCVVAEIPTDTALSFEFQVPALAVVAEFSTVSFSGLLNFFSELRTMRCTSVYTSLDAQYFTFIRDFNQAKRLNRMNVALRQTRSSSFEASLLKIKEIVTSKKLTFLEDSTIRSQLTSFSKVDLKNENHFYAIRAFSMVIDAFKPEHRGIQTASSPDPSAWY